MVDTTNPTTQFHPYERPDVTPHSETPATGFWGALKNMGINGSVIDRMKGTVGNVDVQSGVTKARDYARLNPGKVLGGMAAAVIAAGLLRRRHTR